MNLTAIADPGFYALAIPAVLITGISKAGLGGAVGSLAVPLIALSIAPSQAVAIMLPILLAMDALGLFVFRGRVDKAVLAIAIPAGLLGIALGWLLFRAFDERWLRLLIGVQAVTFGALKLFEGAAAWRGPAQARRVLPTVVWSSLSGFSSFISHAGGPPMMQLMLPLRLPPVLMVGTLTWYFAVINFSKLGPYAALGLFNWRNLGTSLALLALVPLGYWLGYWMLQRIAPASFVRLASIGLLATGLKLLADALLH